MLRITPSSDENLHTLKLEGRLVKPWVAEVAKAWRALRKTAGKRTLVVDLNAVSEIDRDGKRLLQKMQQERADFRAEGFFVQYTLQQLSKNARKRRRH